MTLSPLQAAREAGGTTALRGPGFDWTYAALAERVRPLLPLLAGAPRVLVTPRLDPHSLLPLYAALELGIPFVLLHPRLAGPERAALAALCAPALDGDGIAGAAPVLDGDVIAGAMPSLGSEATVPAPPPDDGRPAAILFTSGTSGTPKGVVLARAAFVASAAASAVRLGWEADDAWLLALPPAHVGGLSILTRCLLARRTVVIDADLRRGLATATLASLVPAQLDRLLAEVPAWRCPPRLRALLVGGAAAPAPLLAEARRRGLPVRETYGLTEACSQVATQQDGDPPGTATLLPGYAARIVDGTIQLRGPSLLSGYFPAGAHADPWTPDGWLVTGDRGRLDPAGRLVALGRSDDVIVTGGENVDPLEVERALEEDPAVARALVFGVPDPRFGQVVAAAIVPRGAAPDAAAIAAAISARLGARLAGFKCPRLYAVVPELPLGPGGKTDRRPAPAVFGGRLLAVPRSILTRSPARPAPTGGAGSEETP